MNANRHFDEDDLVLYALRLLPEPALSDMTERIAEDAEVQRRLSELQIILGVYAEVTVASEPTPEGSLDRLLQRVSVEPKRAQQPTLVPKRTRTKTSAIPLWTAWAVAALLAIAVGLTTQRWLAARQLSDVQSTQVALLSKTATALSQERDTLQADLAQAQGQAANLQTQAESLKSETSSLKTETTIVKSSAAALQSKLAGESSKLNEQTAKTAQAEREQERLQDAFTAQQQQLAQMSATSNEAQVLAALTDPAALRVVLTKPNAKPAPTGRAAYVASKGTLVFLGSNLAALKPTKVYELWLMPANGSNPIAAGTFVPDAKGNVTLAYPHFAHTVAAKGFAITIENAGGSQTPTLPMVLAGS